MRAAVQLLTSLGKRPSSSSKPAHQYRQAPQAMASVPEAMAEAYFSSDMLTFPRPLTVAVAAICIAPFLLNLAGVNFGSTPAQLSSEIAAKLSQSELIEAMHQALEGSYTHTIHYSPTQGHINLPI